MAGRELQAYQVSLDPAGSAAYTACQAPKAFRDPQVLTSTETQASQVLLGREVTEERLTSCQALWESQDRKENRELQGNEAHLGIQDFRGSLASRPLPTSLGHLVTKGRQGYLA